MSSLASDRIESFLRSRLRGCKPTVRGFTLENYRKAVPQFNLETMTKVAQGGDYIIIIEKANHKTTDFNGVPVMAYHVDNVRTSPIDGAIVNFVAQCKPPEEKEEGKRQETAGGRQPALAGAR